MKTKQIDMCNGPMFTKIIAYTIPIILTSVLQILFNAADLVVVGRFCGSNSVAAVGATGSLTTLFVNLFIGISVGAGVCVAHSIGSHDDHLTQRTIHTAIPFSLICGGIVSVIGIILSAPMLRLMNTPEEILPLSSLYMKIYFAGMIFNMLYNFAAAILRASGDSQSPLYFLMISGVVNVVFNVIFVTVFHLDVAGVALATTISQALSAVLVLIKLMRRDDACRFSFAKMKIDSKPLKKMLLIGIPSGLQSTMFAISNVIIQSSVNSFGAIAMSGNAAAASIEGFHYVTLNAFYHTALNFAGQNAGAKKFDRVKKTLVIASLSATAVGLIMGLFIFLFANPLLSIYITDSKEALAYGYERILIFAFTYFMCGVMEVCTGVLRGMGCSLPPMIISIIGVCGFRISWIYTVFQIPKYHTLVSLFLSYPISWIATILCLLAVFMHVYKKRISE